MIGLKSVWTGQSQVAKPIDSALHLHDQFLYEPVFHIYSLDVSVGEARMLYAINR